MRRTKSWRLCLQVRPARRSSAVSLFAPVDKESACHLSERQQKLALEYQNDLAQLRNRYINGEETGFTVLCFPTPEVGEKFPEIFREIIRINTLDYKKYQKIQQTIIDTLDTCEWVGNQRGKGENETDLLIHLHTLTDDENTDKF